MKGKIKLTGIWHFIVFFLLIAFVVTCNFYLFLHSMKLDAETISHPAKVTLVNVLLLTLLFCLVDALRRNEMVIKPVKRIQEGIDRVIKGDFKINCQTL